MEKSLNGDSRKLSRLSTGLITPFAEEISEKRSRFKQKAQFVNHHTQQNTQLPEVYANCIKMCNENKITVQNAFGLGLIDYMAEMVHNDDSEMTNFQVASCTLDASAKIYAHRVDHVHAETFKIAGNLGRNEKDSSIVGEKSHDSSVNSAPKKKKVWKGRRIVSNLDTITLSKITEATDVDPLSKQMTEIFSEGYTGGYLLTTLAPYDDSGELMIDYNAAYYHDKKELSSSTRVKVDVSLLRDLVNSAFLEKEICPHFDSLQFNGVEPLPVEDMQLDIDVTNGNMPFDNVDDVNGNNLGFEDDDDHNGQDDNQMSNNVSGSGENAPPDTVAGFQRAEFIDALSNAPSEYSYFTANFISTWAGPNHWKIRSAPKEKTDEPKVTKPRKANVQKEVKVMDFVEGDLLKFDEKFASVKPQLSVRALNAWRKLKTTLPLERHYKISDLVAVYLAPHIMKMWKVNLESSGQSGPNGEINSTFTDFPPGIENADSSGTSEDLFDRMDNAETQCTPFENADTQGNEIFGGDNLIKAPHMVAKLDINYCKTAKRINFKKLKCSMWKLITKSEKEDFNETLQSIQENNFSTVMFNELYRSLSSYLPHKMVENMSIPIAISCLLHLANERTLELVPENQTDIIIRQG